MSSGGLSLRERTCHLSPSTKTRRWMTMTSKQQQTVTPMVHCHVNHFRYTSEIHSRWFVELFSGCNNLNKYVKLLFFVFISSSSCPTIESYHYHANHRPDRRLMPPAGIGVNVIDLIISGHFFVCNNHTWLGFILGTAHTNTRLSSMVSRDRSIIITDESLNCGDSSVSWFF